jgi:integrase
MAEQGLTDLAIRKMPNPDRRTEIWDAKIPGFGLRVAPTGLKVFMLVYRHQGKSRRLALGRYPFVSLAEARNKAIAALKDLASGIDPAGDPEAEAAEAARLESYTFAKAVDAFVRLHCQRYNRAVTARDTERILNNRFVSRWAKRDIREITRTDILKVLDDTVEHGLPSAANHALSAIRKFFNWCVERGMLEASPCQGVKKPANNLSRERVLDADELAAVWKGAQLVGYPFGPIVKLLILTAQRRNEVAHMQWSQIDLEAGLWSLPSELTKNGRPHLVPLAPEALSLLKTLPRFTSDYVFPARGEHPAFAHFSRGKLKLDALAGVDDWTLHDLRRTAATHMAQLGVAPHVIERLLNHISGTFGGVAGVYNRFQYLDEMRAGLKAWEDRIAATLTHDK